MKTNIPQQKPVSCATRAIFVLNVITSLIKFFIIIVARCFMSIQVTFILSAIFQ